MCIKSTNTKKCEAKIAATQITKTTNKSSNEAEAANKTGNWNRNGCVNAIKRQKMLNI